MFSLLFLILSTLTTTQSQSTGVITLSSPGSCVILSQVATLQTPNFITAMVPICPDSGAVSISWPLTNDGDGAASSAAIYADLEGYRAGFVRSISQMQAMYMLGRTLRWQGEGTLYDETEGAVLHDPITAQPSGSCGSSSNLLPPDLTLPDTSSITQDDPVWDQPIALSPAGTAQSSSASTVLVPTETPRTRATSPVPSNADSQTAYIASQIVNESSLSSSDSVSTLAATQAISSRIVTGLADSGEITSTRRTSDLYSSVPASSTSTWQSETPWTTVHHSVASSTSISSIVGDSGRETETTGMEFDVPVRPTLRPSSSNEPPPNGTVSSATEPDTTSPTDLVISTAPDSYMSLPYAGDHSSGWASSKTQGSFDSSASSISRTITTGAAEAITRSFRTDDPIINTEVVGHTAKMGTAITGHPTGLTPDPRTTTSPIQAYESMSSKSGSQIAAIQSASSSDSALQEEAATYSEERTSKGTDEWQNTGGASEQSTADQQSSEAVPEDPAGITVVPEALHKSSLVEHPSAHDETIEPVTTTTVIMVIATEKRLKSPPVQGALGQDQSSSPVSEVESTITELATASSSEAQDNHRMNGRKQTLRGRSIDRRRRPMGGGMGGGRGGGRGGGWGGGGGGGWGEGGFGPGGGGWGGKGGWVGGWGSDEEDTAVEAQDAEAEGGWGGWGGGFWNGHTQLLEWSEPNAAAQSVPESAPAAELPTQAAPVPMATAAALPPGTLAPASPVLPAPATQVTQSAPVISQVTQLVPAVSSNYPSASSVIPNSVYSAPSVPMQTLSPSYMPVGNFSPVEPTAPASPPMPEVPSGSPAVSMPALTYDSSSAASSSLVAPEAPPSSLSIPTSESLVSNVKGIPHDKSPTTSFSLTATTTGAAKATSKVPTADSQVSSSPVESGLTISSSIVSTSGSAAAVPLVSSAPTKPSEVVSQETPESNSTEPSTNSFASTVATSSSEKITSSLGANDQSVPLSSIHESGQTSRTSSPASTVSTFSQPSPSVASTAAVEDAPTAIPDSSSESETSSMQLPPNSTTSSHQVALSTPTQPPPEAIPPTRAPEMSSFTTSTAFSPSASQASSAIPQPSSTLTSGEPSVVETTNTLTGSSTDLQSESQSSPSSAKTSVLAQTEETSSFFVATTMPVQSEASQMTSEAVSTTVENPTNVAAKTELSSINPAAVSEATSWSSVEIATSTEQPLPPPPPQIPTRSQSALSFSSSASIFSETNSGSPWNSEQPSQTSSEIVPFAPSVLTEPSTTSETPWISSEQSTWSESSSTSSSSSEQPAPPPPSSTTEPASIEEPPPPSSTSDTPPPPPTPTEQPRTSESPATSESSWTEPPPEPSSSPEQAPPTEASSEPAPEPTSPPDASGGEGDGGDGGGGSAPVFEVDGMTIGQFTGPGPVAAFAIHPAETGSSADSASGPPEMTISATGSRTSFPTSPDGTTSSTITTPIPTTTIENTDASSAQTAIPTTALSTERSAIGLKDISQDKVCHKRRSRSHPSRSRRIRRI